jgi:hypothetical protein
MTPEIETAIRAVTLVLLIVGGGALWMLQAANRADERKLEMLRQLALRASAAPDTEEPDTEEPDGP